MGTVGDDCSGGCFAAVSTSGAQLQPLNPETTTHGSIQILIDGWVDGHKQKPRGVPLIPSLQNPGPKAFLMNPRIIHIGPYHSTSSGSHLRHPLKLGFLHSLCSRAANHQENDSRPFLELCTEVVRGMEADLMACYDRDACCVAGEEFVKTLVIDACFVVEYLHRSKEGEAHHLLNGSEYLIPQINDDLLLFKNQLPFSLLKKIHHLAFPEQRSGDEFRHCALNFIFHMLKLHTSFGPRNHLHKRGRSGALHFPDSEHSGMNELAVIVFDGAHHFLDLYRRVSADSRKLSRRSFLNPVNILKEMLWGAWVAFCGENDADDDHLIPSIPSATSLNESGIELKRNRSSLSLLSVDFNHGALDMPFLVLNLSTMRLLKNLSELEKHSPDEDPIFTSYIRFMDHIINTKQDIALLQRNGIILHTYGSDKKAAEGFNGMIHGESQVNRNYLLPVYKEINKHCRSARRMMWVSFKHKYFSSPWSFIALLSAIILLALTFLQTFYTLQAYYHPPHA